MRVLDLYGGLGGTDIGITSVLEKKGIKYEYVAIEIDPIIAEAHRKNNPKSKVIVADALSWLSEVKNFDFIWASPPCHTHSQWQMINKGRGIEIPKPDPTLWFLIREFRMLGINFVVENVRPYYKKPIDNSVRIGRQLFWSSFPIKPFQVKETPKKFNKMTIKDWKDYHKLETIKGNRTQQRKALRNVVHPSIAAGIFEQFLEPKILGIQHFLKELPGAEQKA